MSYLALIILVIIGIIIIASIFKPSFQEKIFGGSESEARIAGILSVRGVSFVTLIVGLIGVAVYYELKREQRGSINKAMEYLKDSKTDQFSLQFSKEDSIDIKINGISVRRIKQPINLTVSKSLNNKNKYDVIYENVTLGDLKLEVLEHSLIYNVGNIYWQDSSYNIENTNFWFKIENIESLTIGQGKKIARYLFRFGEGQSNESVKWSDKIFDYGKTDNGQLPNRLKIIHDENWNNSYAIALGAGLYGNYNDKYYIEIINAIFVKINIEE